MTFSSIVFSVMQIAMVDVLQTNYAVVSLVGEIGMSGG
jgi:hypothetical protein